MGDNNFSDLGQQMADAVQSALRSGDFSQLKGTVSSTLNDVVEKTISYGKNSMPPLGGQPPFQQPPFDQQKNRPYRQPPNRQQGQPYNGQYRQPPNGQQGQPYNGQYRQPPNGQQGQPYNGQYRQPPNGQQGQPYDGQYRQPPNGQQYHNGQRQYNGQPQYRQPPTYTPYQPQRVQPADLVPQDMMDRYLNVDNMNKQRSKLRWMNFNKYLGAAFCLGYPISILSLIGIGAAFGTSSVFTIPAVLSGIVSSLLCFGLLALGIVGSVKLTRAKRYFLYWSAVSKKGFCDIKVLSYHTKKTQSSVLKELNQLIAAGKYPEGHIDDQRTCFMVGDKIYQQYLGTQEHVKEPEPKEDDPVLAEGRDCIRQIREVNDALPDEEISGKLTRLEDVTTKIFAYVGKRPNKLPEIRRFMSYYLPTTLKLVHSYRDFENQSVQGANITQAKTEILEILDTINIAFETLFDGLFEEDAMDISSDISALKTILSQEGLTHEEGMTQ